MPHEPGPTRALLFVADLTSRAEFLAAFAPYATESSILIVTHRSELPETGDRLIFRLALADGQTMLAGEAVVTDNRGAGRRGVARLAPRRLDTDSRAMHAELVARARTERGVDRMDEAMERLTECHVLEEAQAIGQIDAADQPTLPEVDGAVPPILVAEEDPAPPTRRLHGLAIAAVGVAAFTAALLGTLFILPTRQPEPVPAVDRVTLHLRSYPPGARFQVNGVEVGPAPTSIQLPPGTTASIRANLDGRVWRRRLPVAADQPSISIRAVLGE